MKKSNKSAGKITSASLSTGKDKNINVRKIENGYIVRESGTTGSGRSVKYFEKEYFSTSNPVEIKMPVKFGNKK